MDVNGQKEQFSIAYLHALVAVAGLKLDRYSVDDDSVDVLISRAGDRSPHLSVQLKCSSDIELRNKDFALRLKLKNYHDLRRVTFVPRILAVLHVPKDIRQWIDEEPGQVALRHRVYWKNLLGEAEIIPARPQDWQEKKITVSVPLANLLTPARLIVTMDNIDGTSAI